MHSKSNELCLFRDSTATSIWWRGQDQTFINQYAVRKLVLDKFGLVDDKNWRKTNFIRFISSDEFKLFLKLKQNVSMYIEFEF